MRRTFGTQKEKYGQYSVVVKNEGYQYNNVYYSDNYGESYRIITNNNFYSVKEAHLSEDGNTAVIVSHDNAFMVCKIDTGNSYSNEYFDIYNNEPIINMVINKEVSKILYTTGYAYGTINLHTLRREDSFNLYVEPSSIRGVCFPNQDVIDMMLYMTSTQIVKHYAYGGESSTNLNKTYPSSMKMVCTGEYPLKILAIPKTSSPPNFSRLEYDTASDPTFTFKSAMLSGDNMLKMSEKGVIINVFNNSYVFVSKFENITGYYGTKESVGRVPIKYVGVSDTDDTHVIGTFRGFYFYKGIRDRSHYFLIPTPPGSTYSNILAMATNI